jgi:serine/threonine-protein kinase HipA
MTTAADVLLWGTRIASVALPDGSDVATFAWDRDFLRSGIQPSPLVLPLDARVHAFPELSRRTFHGLPGLLADSLPDKFGNAVIDAWLASQGRPASSMNAVERLCYTGTRGMGALEYVPALGPEPSAADELDLARLTELAQRILVEREKLQVSTSDAAMSQIIRVGTSAGGARAKALIAWNELTGEVRSGQVAPEPGFGQWLLKFDGVAANADKEGADAPHYTQIEYAYHLMATAAGIDMCECRLYAEGERRHFLTRRFDRTPDGGKLHMQTLGAIAHFDFGVVGVYGYEDAARVMRALGLGQPDIVRLYRRMVFNVVARNQDDHVKNLSFLMDRRGVWQLAPAYDVTYAYNPDGVWTGMHQMTVAGKREHIEESDLVAAARSMSLRPAVARDVLEEVRAAVRRWLEFAQVAGVPERQAYAIRSEFCLLD